MNRGSGLLHLQSDRWYAVIGDPEANTTDQGFDGPVDQRVEQLRRWQAGVMDRANRPWLVCLEAPDCLAADFACDDLPRRHRRNALAYRFEEHLPLAIEQLTADYLQGPSRCLGIAAQRDWLEPQLKALRAGGLSIAAVMPHALLTAQALIESMDLRFDGQLLWVHGDDADWLTCQAGRPVRWRHLTAEPQALQRELACCALSEPAGDDQPLHIVEDQADRAAAFSPITGPAVQSHDRATVDGQVHRFARAIIDGQASPWLDLQRDDPGGRGRWQPLGRPLGLLAASWLIGLLLISAGLLYRAQRLDRQAAASDRRAEQLYASTYPGQAVPLSIVSRLQSERRRLGQLSGRSVDLPQYHSALTGAYQLLRRLPTDLRYRLLEIRIDGPTVHLEGQARSHADADAIARALRIGQGFTVDPPRTESLRQRGVAFRLDAAMDLPADPQSQTGVARR